MLFTWLLGGGCFPTTITPPAHPQEPVTVFVTDYGRHSSLLLPVNPDVPNTGYDEYAYGDDDFFNIGHNSTLNGIRALLFSSKATIGRRHVDFSGDARVEEVLKLLGCMRVIKFEASRLRAEALKLDLDANFSRSRKPAVYSNYSNLYHVDDPDHYWLFHNCNHATADWLRRLGCEVNGSSIYSNFKLAQ